MYYGFDIGGTKIALGVFDSGRQLQWEKRVPTPRDSYDAFLDAVCELVAEADGVLAVKVLSASVFRECRKQKMVRCMPPMSLLPAVNRCVPT